MSLSYLTLLMIPVGEPLWSHYVSCNKGNAGLQKHNGALDVFFAFWRRLGPLVGGRVLEAKEVEPFGAGNDARLDGLITGIDGGHDTGIDAVITNTVRSGAMDSGAADRPLVAAGQVEQKKKKRWAALAGAGYGFVPLAFEATGAFGNVSC